MDDDESDTSSNQRPQSFLLKFMRFLNLIAQDATYSNFLKTFLSFLIAFLSLNCFKSDSAKFDVNGNQLNSTQFNSTVPANLSSFSYLDVYIWYVVGVIISSILNFYILIPNVIRFNAILLYVGNGVIRLLFRHFLSENHVFDCLFRVGQILFIITSVAVREYDGWINDKSMRKLPYLDASILILYSTIYSGGAFNASIIFSSQRKISMCIDVFYICLLTVHCKRILKINTLINYYANEEERMEYDFVDELENDSDFELEKDDYKKLWKKGKHAENQLEYYRRELIYIFIQMYLILASTLFDPFDVFKLVFIDQVSMEECESASLFALIYGVSMFCGMIIVGILRYYNLVPRLYLTTFAFIGHFITSAAIYFNYEKITFDELVANNEKFTLSIACIISIAICLSVLNYQLVYYCCNFKDNSTPLFRTLKSIFVKLSVLPIFYLKLNYGREEQFSSLLVAGSMAFIALWYFEQIAKQHVFPDVNNGQVRNSGQDVEFYANSERRDGWSSGEDH